MGKLKTETSIKSRIEWPFAISIDISFSAKPKVAFLSSRSRTFFPSDTGTSRFGIYNALNFAPVDIPKSNGFPKDDRLNKPISHKGYGIGGLSGSRWAKLNLANNPSPTAYQKETVPRMIKLKVQRKKKRPSKSKRNSKSGENKEENKLDEIKVSSKFKIVTVKEIIVPEKKDEEALRKMCLQKFVGFGSYLSLDRFGKYPSWNCVGVGYYDMRKLPTELARQGSFGNGPNKMIYPTIARCNYKGYDRCFECDDVQRTVDYYRTYCKIVYPTVRFKENEYGKRKSITVNSDRTNDNETETSEDGPTEKKILFANLCRKCYCKGMRDQSRFWNREQIAKYFKKTRHCSFIHDHNNIPEFTHKTDCNYIHKLSRKEAVLSRYYLDQCDRVLKEKK